MGDFDFFKKDDFFNFESSDSKLAEENILSLMNFDASPNKKPTENKDVRLLKKITNKKTDPLDLFNLNDEFTVDTHVTSNQNDNTFMDLSLSDQQPQLNYGFSSNTIGISESKNQPLSGFDAFSSSFNNLLVQNENTSENFQKTNILSQQTNNISNDIPINSTQNHISNSFDNFYDLSNMNKKEITNNTSNNNHYNFDDFAEHPYKFSIDNSHNEVSQKEKDNFFQEKSHISEKENSQYEEDLFALMKNESSIENKIEENENIVSDKHNNEKATIEDISSLQIHNPFIIDNNENSNPHINENNENNNEHVKEQENEDTLHDDVYNNASNYILSSKEHSQILNDENTNKTNHVSFYDDPKQEENNDINKDEQEVKENEHQNEYENDNDEDANENEDNKEVNDNEYDNNNEEEENIVQLVIQYDDELTVESNEQMEMDYKKVNSMMDVELNDMKLENNFDEIKFDEDKFNEYKFGEIEKVFNNNLTEQIIHKEENEKKKENNILHKLNDNEEKNNNKDENRNE